MHVFGASYAKDKHDHCLWAPRLIPMPNKVDSEWLNCLYCLTIPFTIPYTLVGQHTAKMSRRCVGRGTFYCYCGSRTKTICWHGRRGFRVWTQRHVRLKSYNQALSLRLLIHLTYCVYTCYSFSSFLTVASWGRGSQGQLGLGESVVESETPLVIPYFNEHQPYQVQFYVPFCRCVCSDRCMRGRLLVEHTSVQWLRKTAN